jgi:DNA-binding NtrC family response regulator
MNPKPRVLVIEDDPGVAGSLKKELEAEGYDVAVALRGDDGLTAAKQAPFDVVITDLKMPGLSGLDLVDQLHAAKPRLPIILMTAYGTTETAIDATRLGAYEYVLKPFEMTELLDLVAKAVACDRPTSGLLELGAADSNQPAIVGRSRAMQTLYKQIGQAGQASMNVLIRGETGTGKELVARAIHQHSSRAAKPFVAVNCTAIPETLLESELFGHERGAFTGAHVRRLGRFEEAGGGTLFLDEIGDLNPGTQAKLLRVLQEKYIQRVGGNEKIRVDARVLAATHRDLETAMKEKQVREDLFYRLSAMTIRVPSLRERSEDIPDLVRHCLSRFSGEAGVATPSIQLEAVDFLRRQSWPGNVRELENVIQRALLLACNHPIGLAHVQEAHAHAERPLAVPDQTIARYFADLIANARQGKIANAHALMIEDMERELFTQAIQVAKGNQVRAARWSGVTRKTLREKLVHFGLRPATPEPVTESDE